MRLLVTQHAPDSHPVTFIVAQQPCPRRLACPLIVRLPTALRMVSGPCRRLSGSRRRVAQAGRNHFIESREILSFSEGQAAVDLEERVKPGAADQQGKNHRHAATGILRKCPFAGIASADHLSKVAAPQARLEIQVFRRLAVEDLLQLIYRSLAQIETLAMVIPCDANGLLGISTHHLSQGCEVAFGQIGSDGHCVSLSHTWICVRQASLFSERRIPDRCVAPYSRKSGIGTSRAV